MQKKLKYILDNKNVILNIKCTIKRIYVKIYTTKYIFLSRFWKWFKDISENTFLLFGFPIKLDFMKFMFFQ